MTFVPDDLCGKIQHMNPGPLLPAPRRTFLPVKNIQTKASHSHYLTVVSYFFHENKNLPSAAKSDHQNTEKYTEAASPSSPNNSSAFSQTLIFPIHLI